MATHEDIPTWIRTENAGDDSVDDQILMARWFLDHRISRLHDRVARTSQVEDHLADQLTYTVRTCLDNLAEIDVLDQLNPPGTGRYIRHHRSETNFFDPRDRAFVPYLEEDLSRLISDLAERSLTPQLADGGEADESDEEAGVPKQTIRAIAAETLNVPEDDVEERLTEPDDPIEQMNRYDVVVKAIKNCETVTRERRYDEMGWRNMALRWTLSERATHMSQHHTLESRP